MLFQGPPKQQQQQGGAATSELNKQKPKHDDKAAAKTAAGDASPTARKSSKEMEKSRLKAQAQFSKGGSTPTGFVLSPLWAHIPDALEMAHRQIAAQQEVDEDAVRRSIEGGDTVIVDHANRDAGEVGHMRARARRTLK